MTLLFDDENLYSALLTRDESYDGFCFVCVKTTKIFCKLSCGARKPLQNNVEFVKTSEEAINKGYRACKMCKPLDIGKPKSALTEKLINLVHANPEKRWTAEDVAKLGVDSSTIRRAFKRDFGVTFLQYAREHRLGAVVKNIKAGNKIIDAQLDAGFQSASGFNDAINREIGISPKALKNQKICSARWFQTPIGAMLGIVNDEGVLLLEFAERKGLPKELQDLKKKIGPVCFQNHPNLDALQNEIDDYFKGKFHPFNLPIVQWGTQFEKSVWAALQSIPLGQTRSYSEQAKTIGNPNAVRAVARANGANKVAIFIPCHRVIGSDGSMTGYAGKIWRKQWLLEHEGRFIPSQE